MSLYGDLPPPSNEGDSTPNKESSSSPSSSATIVKPALPAAWAASVTRFKPMLNRKPAPPKPKPAQRPMPAGFVAQSTVIIPSLNASAPIAGGNSDAKNPSAMSVAGLDSTSSKTAETTLDDNSWLKARTAQVQRQDNDAQMLTKKQAKRQLSRTQQGPLSLDDEYDIARPNEYEEFKAMFETELEVSLCVPIQISIQILLMDTTITLSISARWQVDLPGVEAGAAVEAHLFSPDAQDPDHLGGNSIDNDRKAFAPPPSLISDASARQTTHVATTTAIAKDISGEDAFMRRAQLSQQRATQSTGHPVSFLAHAQQKHRPMQQENRVGFVPTSQSSLSKGSPTSVILLTNMVGPGEVDDSLQEETAAECEKFGPVVRCLIFEIQNGKVPQEEAVRIFVKFGTAVAAEKALRDLDGRFFGGRQVRGQFFDEKRFDALQLAP
ncbi:hypothetical protein BGZ92_004774 [Podila epicladia]|nr:hypothetical protein BGZ92_004774 [Podila epicladia]